MLRKFAAALVAAAVGIVIAAGAQAQSWKDKVPVFRIGLLGGENTQDRLARYNDFQKLLSDALGIPVKLFPAADYAGVMQGIAAGQLEAAEFGASGFAGAYLDCKCIEPIVVPQEKDGSTYYYSVMVVRADSGIKSIADMKGHSLAWADPNSTSGYLIPSATLKSKGIDLKDGAYFSKTGFSGGHEQGVVAVLNKQYDAAVTWTWAGRRKRGLHPRQSSLDGGQAHAENVGHPHHLAVRQNPERPVGGAQRLARGSEGEIHTVHAGAADDKQKGL
jgi:phosphonate transport system substrate-binding protein